jgi:hypothetical protein
VKPVDPPKNSRRGVWVPAQRPGRRGGEFVVRFQSQSTIPPPNPREFFQNIAPFEIRGRREMPGARCTRGLVCNVHKGKRTRAYRFSGGTPAFPAKWFYGL